MILHTRVVEGNLLRTLSRSRSYRVLSPSMALLFSDTGTTLVSAATTARRCSISSDPIRCIVAVACCIVAFSLLCPVPEFSNSTATHPTNETVRTNLRSTGNHTCSMVITLNFLAVPKITPNARASSLSFSLLSAAASSELNVYPKPASPITSSVARASHGNTSSRQGALPGSDDADGAPRDLTVLGRVGDAFEGTNDENGFGMNDVVMADGLSVLAVVAGSGSASPGAGVDSSEIAKGSAGVKKDLGEAVISSQMSRNFREQEMSKSVNRAGRGGQCDQRTRIAFSQNIGVRDRIWAAENAGFCGGCRG